MLIERAKPDEAEDLLRQVIEAHPDKDDMNLLGIMVAHRSLEEGKEILHQAMDAGDTRCAPCNLAHLALASDADLARRLYERGLEFDEPEAWCGLSYILRDDDPAKAAEYLDMLHNVADIETPMEFFLDFVALASKTIAIEAGVYFADNGFEVARRKVLELSFGSSYKPKTGLLEYGKTPSGNDVLRWHVLELMQDRVLLLAENSMRSMAYVNGASDADWDNSAVRQWLNGEFAKAAFGGTDDGTSRILRVSGDLVTCLTLEEFESLINGSASANPACTDLATRQKAAWWLKAAGNKTMSAPYVKENGEAGWAFSLVEHGVRPAVWLALTHDA